MPVRHSRVTRPSRAVPPAAALAFLADAFAGLFTSVLFNCGMGTCSMQSAVLSSRNLARLRIEPSGKAQQQQHVCMIVSIWPR